MEQLNGSPTVTPAGRVAGSIYAGRRGEFYYDNLAEWMEVSTGHWYSSEYGTVFYGTVNHLTGWWGTNRPYRTSEPLVGPLKTHRSAIHCFMATMDELRKGMKGG